jgi:predicted CoA-binding protein
MSTSGTLVREFVTLPAMALVGVSRSGRKFGNIALRQLRARGYRVYPVHPLASIIDGVRCYRSLAELPERVGGVVIVLPPDSAISVVRDAAAAGIPRVWIQQGGSSPYVLEVCGDLGLKTIADECILMYAAPTGVHRAHRFVHGLLHRQSA